MNESCAVYLLVAIGPLFLEGNTSLQQSTKFWSSINLVTSVFGGSNFFFLLTWRIVSRKLINPKHLIHSFLPQKSVPIALSCSLLSWGCWSLQQGSLDSPLPSPSSCPAPLLVWFPPFFGQGGGWWHKGKGKGPKLSQSFCVRSKTISGPIRFGQILKVLLNRWSCTKSTLCWVCWEVSSDGEACTPAGKQCLVR